MTVEIADSSAVMHLSHSGQQGLILRLMIFVVVLTFPRSHHLKVGMWVGRIDLHLLQDVPWKTCAFSQLTARVT